MSSFTGYNRRPVNSNTGYYPNEYPDQYSTYNATSDYGYGSGSDYDRGRYRGRGHNNYNNYNTYNGYSDYEDDHTRQYGPRRRNSYDQHYPESPATYSNVIPSGRPTQYIDATGGYRSTRSSRRKPIVISGNGTTYNARPAVRYLNTTSSSSSGYQARGERGEHIPVSTGLSYFDEGISLSVWIRRLFGLGPRRSRSYVGQSVHVKRWDVGRGWFSKTPARSNTSTYTI